MDSFYARKRKRRGGWKKGRSKKGFNKSAAVTIASKRQDNMTAKMKMNGPLSVVEQPYMFYSKAMVMDPWRSLTPVVGCILVRLPSAMELPRPWLPDSVAVKEQSTASSSSSGSRSRRLDHGRSSLAECLALSFEEASGQ